MIDADDDSDDRAGREAVVGVARRSVSAAARPSSSCRCLTRHGQHRRRVLRLLATRRRRLDPADDVAVVVGLDRLEVDRVHVGRDVPDAERELDLVVAGERPAGPGRPACTSPARRSSSTVAVQPLTASALDGR